MDELRIVTLFTIAPLIIVMAAMFLWNLWLAPYRLLDEKLDRIEKSSSQPGETTLEIKYDRADPAKWKHVQELKLFQAAELCGGVSPHGASEGSNDRARAAYSELLAALRAGTLKGSDEPEWANFHTRIKRKDLQKYLGKRGDYPEFLKD